MALVVEQRPEAELFVEENPTIYDTPYYTSRVNAANLPLVYKISNTKFPVNTEDTIEDILSVSSNNGFAQLTLDAATYTFLAKGFVKVTNTINYNGIFQIREVVDSNNIVINTSFVSSETGNVQNYYKNYSTLVKVYAGIPEYHPLNSENPLTLITDNPITIVPNSDNEATIDVSALVKSELSLDSNLDQNDTNFWTAFYIEYAESFDESDGTTVSTTTTAFTEDEIVGCTSGGTEFVTNGDFATDLSGWSNISIGQDWFYDAGVASVTLSSTNRKSKALIQTGLALTDGTEYALSFDYILGSENVTITVINNSVIYQETLTGSGTVNITFIAGSDQISFSYRLVSSTTDTDFSLDNVSITNELVNPCLALIFATHSAQQPQYRYGGNMGEYVQNFNGQQFANKWLTLMEQPVLFQGNYFDLSTYIPQAVIQAAIQSGGYFLEVIEFDSNGVVIAENQYPITQNLGDGIYRFRLDDKSFNSSTQEFTVQILRVPVNLFVDGDQGTFDTTTDPTGNPPSDWNLEKDTRAIINFDNTLSFEGAASLSFESRSIFNDNYALDFNTDFETDQFLRKSVVIPESVDLDYTQDFIIEFELYPKSVNLSLTQEYFNRGGDSFRTGILANSSDFFFQWIPQTAGGGRGEGKILTSPINVNQWNTVTITFTHGTSVELNVNGSIVNNTIAQDSTLFNEAVTSILSKWGGETVTIGANSRYTIDAIQRNFKLTFNSVLTREYKCNQEQGSKIFDTVNQVFDAEFDENYDDSELAFGGGVWIDVSGL